MILYHGSDRTVTDPKLQTDATKKELGSGFYLTPDSAQAAAAARTRVRREQRLLEKKSDYDRGVVSIFELDENVPLKVFRFESTTAEWLQFAAVNFKNDVYREQLTQDILSRYSDYDVIIGKRPDDHTSMILTAYLAESYGTPESADAINSALSHVFPEQLSEHYCFRTEQAIHALKFQKKDAPMRAPSKKFTADRALTMAAQMLAAEQGISGIDALKKLIKSPVYDAIYDLETGMWREGPSSILEAYKQRPEKEF